jgi:hypothetical protein
LFVDIPTAGDRPPVSSNERSPTMRFMMFVCVAEKVHVPADEASVPDVDDWVDTYDGSGVRVLGEQLVGPGQAKTIRVRDGKTVVTDGPFAETKEFIAGFDVLECADLDAAISVAAAHPMAHTHMIELRPFWHG